MRYLALALAVSLVTPAMGDGVADLGIREISKCWAVGSASTDAMSSIVVLDAVFNPAGSVERVELVSSEGPSDPGIQSAYEMARRALMRCGKNGKIWASQTVRIEFDYNTMRLRVLETPSFKAIEI